MYYTPLNYDKINVMAGTYQPSTVKAFNNQYFAFWERSLFQRAQSSIILNVPWDGSERDFLYYCLFRFGYVAVLDTTEYGLIFQPCTLSGYDIYYQPTKCIITNPAFKDAGLSREYELGKEASLIKLAPDYYGIWDCISHYAEKLAGMDSAINMSIINSKFAYILGARNKGAASALKKVFDKVNEGNPTVVFDQKILNDQTDKEQPFQYVELPALKNSYLANDQLVSMQTILNAFDAEIGIPTVPYQKKERMVTSEAESRVVDSIARATVWNNTLNESMQVVNGMFGTSMSAEIRNNPEELEDDNEEVNDNGTF